MFIKDRLTLSTKRVYTDEGFLIVPAKISRTGIQEYYAVEMGLTDREASEVVRVYRPAEEVFKDESLASFQNKPVTDNHPPVLVDASNAKEYSVGHAGPSVLRDGEFAATDLFITDGAAIKKVEGGKVELSNGYTADIDWTPGVTPDGQVYDAVQRNIKGNHVAIVERGRAGPSCRVADNLPTNEDESIMAKITVDGVDYDVSEGAALAVKKVQVRLADAEEETKEEKKKAEDAEEEMAEKEKEAKKTEDSLRARLDDAKSKILTDKDLDAKVEERAAFIDTVKKIAPSINWKGKDAITIKKEVVALARPNVQLDSQSDDYVNASFDLIVDSVNNDSQSALDQAIVSQFTKPVTDSNGEVTDNRPAHLIARDKHAESTRAAWKNGGAK